MRNRCGRAAVTGRCLSDTVAELWEVAQRKSETGSQKTTCAKYRSSRVKMHVQSQE